MAAYEESHRLYNCGRCGVQVRICRRCDRGNVYCALTCANSSRRESLRRAAKRYQGGYWGAVRHAARQGAWRRRRRRAETEIVTHQGSAEMGGTGTVAAPSTVPLVNDADAADPRADAPSVPLLASHVSGSTLRGVFRFTRPRCHFCRRRLSRFTRLGPLRGGP